MSPNIPELLQTLQKDSVILEPLKEEHLQPLKAACAKDRDIWEIYPVSMLDEHFEDSVSRFHNTDHFLTFAVINAESGDVVGMTNFIGADQHGSVEIGGTYIAPEVRGTGFNRTMKTLLIDHAFSCGFHRIQFCVDVRNERSTAAVLKLGATKEGILRKNRKTWTGYIRDTAVFSILKEEWT